jgi:transcriptional regulator with XRE-family HTH domain
MPKTSPKHSLLDRIRDAYREKYKAKPTQTQIATIAGVRQPSVSDWGKDGKFPELRNAVALAVDLDVSLEWLLTERGPRRVPPADAESQLLWKLWRQLDDLGRSKVIAYTEQRLEAAEADEPVASSKDRL